MLFNKDIMRAATWFSAITGSIVAESRQLPLPDFINDHASNMALTTFLCLPLLINHPEVRKRIFQDLPAILKPQSQQAEELMTLGVTLSSITIAAILNLTSEISLSQLGNLLAEGWTSHFALNEIFPDLGFGFLGIAICTLMAVSTRLDHNPHRDH